jgi:hypothetical protein
VLQRGGELGHVGLEPVDDRPRVAADPLGAGDTLLPQSALDRTPNPRANGHAVGVGEPPDLVDRLRREADGHVLGERPIGASTWSAGCSLAVSGIVVVIEALASLSPSKGSLIGPVFQCNTLDLSERQETRTGQLIA